MTIMNQEDKCLWADGTWCNFEDLGDYLVFMSDDFESIPLEEWCAETENRLGAEPEVEALIRMGR